MIIRKLRLDKGWSQEQLAEMSGVSTRTIQRLERGGRASFESMKCLAAVFETDFNELQEPDMPNQDALSPQDRAAINKMHEWMSYDKSTSPFDPDLSDDEREAMEYVRDIKGFYTNLATYVVIMSGLFILNLLTNPGYFWVVWPALGWGVGIAMHGLVVFEVVNLFGADWEKKQIEKRMRRK